MLGGDSVGWCRDHDSTAFRTCFSVGAGLFLRFRDVDHATLPLLCAAALLTINTR